MSDEREQPDRDAAPDGELVPDAPAPADRDPLGPPEPLPPAASPVVVARWVQMVVVPLAALALYALARAAGPVLLLFLVATVIALILNPLVKLVQRARVPRGLAVAAVYIGFFLVVGAAIGLLVDPIADQVQAFQDDVPGLTDSANQSLADLQGWLDDRGVDVHVQEQGETALETLQRNVLEGSGDVVSFTQDLVRTLVEASIALILVLVISIYMLLYGEQIGRLVRAAMPPGDGTPEDDFPIRVQKAVFSYVRGQAAFSAIMGVSAGVALWLFGAIGIFPDGQRYAVFFGAFYGLMELVPYVGPVIGALPAMLVALFQDPLTAVWVGLLFLALQQLEGHVVAPQVFGQALRINPLLVIFALLMGAQLYGIIGAFVALPLAAVARETAVYLRRHLVLEPWSALAPQPATVGGAGAGLADPPRCPDCGTAPGPRDAFCRRCGASLEPRVAAPG